MKATRDLCICRSCAGALVQPVWWRPRGEEWDVLLWCPDCEQEHYGSYASTELERYEEALDAGTLRLHEFVKRFERDALLLDIERFTAACAADAIWPDDFS